MSRARYRSSATGSARSGGPKSALRRLRLLLARLRLRLRLHRLEDQRGDLKLIVGDQQLAKNAPRDEAGVAGGDGGEGVGLGGRRMINII